MAVFVLLDTETTGASKEDRLCQIAFLSTAKASQLEAFEEFCKPPLPIKIDAMAVHHITNEMVENAPVFDKSEAKIRLESLNTEENFLVIHNAPFDSSMLEKEGFLWKGAVIDTLRCAKHLLENEERHALQYLRYSLGLYKKEAELSQLVGKEFVAHDALSDVAVLYLLMQHLLEIVGKNSDGIKRLVELSNTPVLIKKFRFGKHIGKEIADVVKTDRSYLEWLQSSEKQKDDPDSDMLFTLGHYLGK